MQHHAVSCSIMQHGSCIAKSEEKISSAVCTVSLTARHCIVASTCAKQLGTAATLLKLCSRSNAGVLVYRTALPTGTSSVLPQQIAEGHSVPSFSTLSVLLDCGPAAEKCRDIFGVAFGCFWLLSQLTPLLATLLRAAIVPSKQKIQKISCCFKIPSLYHNNIYTREGRGSSSSARKASGA